MAARTLYDQFLTTCVDLPNEEGPALLEAMEHGLGISYRTFVHALGREAFHALAKSLGYAVRGPELTLAKDWAVSFHRITFRDRRCYVLRWSAIEYIYAARG